MIQAYSGQFLLKKHLGLINPQFSNVYFDHTEKYWDILTFWFWASAIMLCFCKLSWIVKLLFQRVQEGAAR